jgi:hypothetical protein
MVHEPLLTQSTKDNRLSFRQRYRNWQEATELRRDPRLTKKTVKHQPKPMAWGCSSWKGRGALEWLKKGEMMNGVSYRQILDERLELFMRQLGTTHLLQDGASYYKSNLVSSWFRERPSLQLINWPGKWQQSRSESHQECLGLDEGAAEGLQGHRPEGIAQDVPSCRS